MTNKFSLCWDCERATGGCPWSDRLRPVKGWTATFLEKTTTRPYSTYLVHECPGFKRDAYDGGTRREPQKEIRLRSKEKKDGLHP